MNIYDSENNLIREINFVDYRKLQEYVTVKPFHMIAGEREPTKCFSVISACEEAQRQLLSQLIHDGLTDDQRVDMFNMGAVLSVLVRDLKKVDEYQTLELRVPDTYRWTPKP